MTTDEKRQKSRERYKRWYEKHKAEARRHKSEAMRRYRAENPAKHRAQSREAKRKLKNAVFDLYGRKCVCCGFADQRALTLDHINNNGAEERRELGERGVYRRALNNYLPLEYRVLCMNCQFIKRIETGRQNQH